MDNGTMREEKEKNQAVAEILSGVGLPMEAVLAAAQHRGLSPALSHKHCKQ